MNRLLFAGAFILLTSAAHAASGIAVSTVNLRAESNTTSEILGKIPGGSRVDVGTCESGWCAVTWSGKSGFAIATALDTSGRPRVVRRPPPRYADDDEYEPIGHGPLPPGYVPVPGPGPAVVYAPRPYYYGPGPYWGGYWGGPRWGYGWRRW
jgi:hypothetical protein